MVKRKQRGTGVHPVLFFHSSKRMAHQGRPVTGLPFLRIPKPAKWRFKKMVKNKEEKKDCFFILVR